MSIRIGLIGVGRMGKVFAGVLAFQVPGVELAAIADPNEQTAQEAAARFGAAASYTDYRELLDRPDIQAVVIATPTATHARDHSPGGRGRKAHLQRKAALAVAA